MKDPAALRRDAISIWESGVAAVRSERLVGQVFHCENGRLTVCGHTLRLSELGRIAVVGAGKAGAGMAEAVEDALFGPLSGEPSEMPSGTPSGASSEGDALREKVTGWINVPADCVRKLRTIHLHAARPAGVNEPTAAGVEGAERILELVGELGPDDLCLVLISGGGSALLPAPVPPLSLDDKQAVTRFLMHAGAPIDQLNRVRKRLSRIKGGGLARASRAGRLIALVISDIVGDPLDLIASGPTFPDTTTNAEALAVLRHYGASPPEVPQRILDFLARDDGSIVEGDSGNGAPPSDLGPQPSASPHLVFNHVIGNNQTAVAAAGRAAQARGYHVILLGSDNQGEANAVGRALAARCRAIRERREPNILLPVCLISGGEPVVHLTPSDQPRRGGRNQQLVLAALEELWDSGMERIVLLSGGTDGEDGPTDAAGAWADQSLLEEARRRTHLPAPYLAINDSYGYFEPLGGLLKTGPTHTNVMDLRVALIDR